MLVRLGSVVIGGLALCALLPAAALGRSVAGDFNGDGRDDLAIGSAYEDVGVAGAAGAVHVTYGRQGKGLRPQRRGRFFTQGTPGMAGNGVEPNSFFGGSLVAGDFDGDGRDDLAIGAAFEDVAGDNLAGTVTVVYGSRRRGLRTRGSRFLHADTGALAGVLGGTGPFALFGLALAAGDFNRDGRDDLAIGVPGAEIGGHPSAGAVAVLTSGRRGVRTRGARLFTQDSGLAGDGAEDFDDFGERLVAGDFNGDRRDDLAIGVPGEGIASGADAADGAVSIVYARGRRGLRPGGSQFLHQGTTGMAGDGPEEFDSFGDALAAGRFDRGRTDDLAVGVPFEDVPAGEDETDGAINVVYGKRRKGLRTHRSQFIHQASGGIAGDGSEAADAFGRALIAGRFGRGPRHDLAVGALSEDIGAVERAGATTVLYGRGRGLRTAGSQWFHQDRQGIKGDGAEQFDDFGATLAVGRFDGGAWDALAISAMSEDIGLGSNQGVVHVLYPRRKGLRLRGNQLLSQNSFGLAGDAAAEEGDRFGCGLPGPAIDTHSCYD